MMEIVKRVIRGMSAVKLISQTRPYRSVNANAQVMHPLIHLQRLIKVVFRKLASACGSKILNVIQLGFLHIFPVTKLFRSHLMDAIFSNLMNSFSVYSIDGLTQHIRQHLQYLLSSRQHSVSYLPDYGLPDINELLTQLPNSEANLCQLVHALIEKFEPRLSQLQVTTKQTEPLTLSIRGVLHQQHPVEFFVRFHAGEATLE